MNKKIALSMFAAFSNQASGAETKPIYLTKENSPTYGVNLEHVAGLISASNEVEILDTEPLWMVIDEEEKFVDFSSIDGFSIRVDTLMASPYNIWTPR